MARYVRALAALGICTTEPDGVIRLTERGELLRFDQSGSMWATAMMLASPQNRDAWAHFDDALRTGESQFERVHGMSLWDFHRAHPESAAIFDRAMAGVATMRSEVLPAACDFTGVNTLVDIGGGNGQSLAQILPRFPGMRGILFDQPHVVPAAGPVLEAAGIADRCIVVGGDFFSRVPSGGDAYLLGNILHDWQDAEATAILRTCHVAMRPGARIWILEGVPKPGDEPDLSKLLDLHMMVMFGARERTEAELGALLAAVGFGQCRRLDIGQPWSVIEAIRE
jgi:hypothetical protein